MVMSMNMTKDLRHPGSLPIVITVSHVLSGISKNPKRTEVNRQPATHNSSGVAFGSSRELDLNETKSIMSTLAISKGSKKLVACSNGHSGFYMKVKLSNIAIILHRPHYPENIGAAARSVRNMGINRLFVVDPVDCDLTRILKMATHNAEEIVAEMEVFDTLREALATCQYVVGTSARTGPIVRACRRRKEWRKPS